MTTEQLAIVVPAIVALVTVWIIAGTQARINRQTLESQRRLAQQERARAAYEDMLHMVGWVMEIVSATKPILERSGPPQEPDMERVRSAQAKIAVHGSPEVKALLGSWAKRRNEFFAAAWLLDRMKRRRAARGRRRQVIQPVVWGAVGKNRGHEKRASRHGSRAH
jgi:hypothetical protein